jgi:hypothetical protein
MNPVAKFEVQPYVFSRAACPTVNKTQQQYVNVRPIFHTMQPILVANGAKPKPVSGFFEKKNHF